MSSKLRINVRTLLTYSTDQLWDILHGEFTLVFPDGEIDTNHRETLYSSYAWDYHRKWPETAISVKHHVSGILNGETLGMDTHIKLINAVKWGSYDAYKDRVSDLQHWVSEIDLMGYKITNNMYNDLSERTEEYVVSLDALDFLEALDNPYIIENTIDIPETADSILNAYDAISKYFNNTSMCGRNALGHAFRSGLSSKNQVHQTIGPRGYLTDIDSTIFTKPIMVGYARGIMSLLDSLIESRSCSKALMLNANSVSDTEYFSRKLQLLCMSVTNLHSGDCGSASYLPWTVRPRTHEGDSIIHTGDLSLIVGKYYLCEDTNTLKVISVNDTHLIGKTIKMRSPVAGCNHPDPYGVCFTCYGKMSEMVQPGTNLGHLNAAYLGQVTTQNVLSTKHFDGSAKLESVLLDVESSRYLKICKDGNSYMFTDFIKNKKVQLVLIASEGKGLTNITDITYVNDIHELNITQVTELSNIGLIVDDGKTSYNLNFTVSHNNRLASLTYQMLGYIKEKGWVIDSKGNYVIDLTDWPLNQSFLTLPLRNMNMADHAASISDLIESRISELDKRDKFVSPSAMLVELFDLVNSRLDVNVAVLEIVLYASMVVSATNNDYRLPKSKTQRGFGVSLDTIPRRSLSGAMAFEDQSKTLRDPLSFSSENRPSYCMDVFICPKETVEDILS